MAKIIFNWEPMKEHVNEQSWFSLKKELDIFGQVNQVYFRPRKRYFIEPAKLIKGLPSWSIPAANLLDKAWENKIISFIIYHTPLVFILGTDLWAVVTVEK